VTVGGARHRGGLASRLSSLLAAHVVAAACTRDQAAPVARVRPGPGPGGATHALKHPPKSRWCTSQRWLGVEIEELAGCPRRCRGLHPGPSSPCCSSSTWSGTWGSNASIQTPSQQSEGVTGGGAHRRGGLALRLRSLLAAAPGTITFRSQLENFWFKQTCSKQVLCSVIEALVVIAAVLPPVRRRCKKEAALILFTPVPRPRAVQSTLPC
jgi:hypothetical protein